MCIAGTPAGLLGSAACGDEASPPLPCTATVTKSEGETGRLTPNSGLLPSHLQLILACSINIYYKQLLRTQENAERLWICRWIKSISHGAPCCKHITSVSPQTVVYAHGHTANDSAQPPQKSDRLSCHEVSKASELWRTTLPRNGPMKGWNMEGLVKTYFEQRYWQSCTYQLGDLRKDSSWRIV